MKDLNLIEIIYYFVSFVAVFLFFIFFEKIKKLVGIYDQPEKFRKVHKSRVAPLGGVIFYLIFIIYVLFVLFLNLESQLFIHNKQLISIIICSTLIFIIGIVDDKHNLGSLAKSIYFLFIIVVYLLNDINSEIFYLKFETFQNTFALEKFSLFFSVFCIFAFMNALNMYDGINLQSGLYLILISAIFLTKSIDPTFFLVNIFVLLVFIFFNYNNKIFLGNNGVYFLSFIFSIFFIKSNIYISKISTEEIFILMAIPGLDMFRLFFNRIINGKSPFLADRNHIHHILLKKFGGSTPIIIFSLTIIPFIFLSTFGYPFYVFLIQILSYFLIVKYSHK